MFESARPAHRDPPTARPGQARAPDPGLGRGFGSIRDRPVLAAIPLGAAGRGAGDPARPRKQASSDDVIESALRREILEELGIEITVIRLLRIDAIPYIAEEPGPYRLDFYFRCAPRDGFAALRRSLNSGQTKPCSPEIKQIRFVALADLTKYDLFSSDVRFLTEDLPRVEPMLARTKNG